MEPSTLRTRTELGEKAVFHPQMLSRREGISVIGASQHRSWNGVVADVWNARLDQGASGEYLSPYPRLFMLLSHKGGDLETRVDAGSALSDRKSNAPSFSFIPAGVRLWASTGRAAQIRHLDIHFDPKHFSERLGEELSSDRLMIPQIMVSDERVSSSARLIEDDCGNLDARNDLYGDALILALLIDVLRVGRHQERKRTPLSPWQLRRVMDYIEENSGENIRLQELAKLVGLSQSYFSHAFKVSTGLPPHQWQLNVRVRKVQEKLLLSDTPLSEIATELGFSDQAHLTRIFRRIVGETPAAWQRNNRFCRNSGAETTG
jgi:AraC-like DNA-binding protein